VRPRTLAEGVRFMLSVSVILHTPLAESSESSESETEFSVVAGHLYI